MNEYEPSMEDMAGYLSGLGQEQASSSIPGTPMMYLEEDQELGAAKQSSLPTSVDIQQGQWLFRVHAGGRVVIVSGPGAGSSYSPGSSRHAEVLANLMGQSRAIADQIIQVYPDARDVARNATQSQVNIPQQTPVQQAPSAQPQPALLPIDYNAQPDVPFYQTSTFKWAVGGALVLGAAWAAWKLTAPKDEGY